MYASDRCAKLVTLAALCLGSLAAQAQTQAQADKAPADFWAARDVRVEPAAAYSIGQGVIWSLISATIFTVSRYYQARRGQHCGLCNDIPDAGTPPPTNLP